jgi:2-hydroxy-3-oxopropionate reductase
VHDVNPAPQFLVDAGVTVCTSAEEVAKRADIVIVMVPDTPHVEAVLFGERALPPPRRRQGPTARSWST